MFKIFCLTLITLLNYCYGENVPIIVWTNIKNTGCIPNTLKYPGESSLHFLQGNFMKCLLRQQPDDIKILVTDTLSQKLISSHEKEFTNLMNILNSEVYEAYPAVDDANIVEDIKTYLQENSGNANISSPYLPDINYDNEESKKKTIQELDNHLSGVMHSTRGKYIAILTAEQSPYQSMNSNGKATGRQLLQANTDVNYNKNFITSDCLYFNFSSANITMGSAASDLTLKSNTTECKYPDAKLTLVFDSVASTELGEVTIQMDFKSVWFNVSGREWWYLATASAKSSLGTTPLDPNTYKDIWSAPSNWSWACYTHDVLKSSAADKTNPATKLQFQIIEIEVFNVTGNAFTSSRVDCSGLLTAGIWMGILVSLLLLAIFSFGMAFIVNVSTMDRFDDPKGKILISSIKD